MLLVSSLVFVACHGGKAPAAPVATGGSTLQWNLHPLADDKTGVALVASDGKHSQTVTLAAFSGAVMPINESFCAGTAYPLHEGQLARLAIYNGGGSGYVVEQVAGAAELSVYSWSQTDGACPDGKGGPTACPEDKHLVATVPVTAGSKFSETIITVGADGTQTPFACK